MLLRSITKKKTRIGLLGMSDLLNLLSLMRNLKSKFNFDNINNKKLRITFLSMLIKFIIEKWKLI